MNEKEFEREIGWTGEHAEHSFFHAPGPKTAFAIIANPSRTKMLATVAQTEARTSL